MDAFCIVFSDTYKDTHISELCNSRTLASIPFGGRYRLIDFILSSFVRANITNVGIVTKNKYNSLVDHLAGGKDWGLDRKNAGLKMMTPFAGNTNHHFTDSKLEALAGIRSYLSSRLQEYCIISDSNVVFQIDFQDVLSCHKKKNADITVIYHSAVPSEDSMLITCNPDGRIRDAVFTSNKLENKEDTSMGIFLLKKELLLSIIDKGITYGLQDLEREVIAKNIDTMGIYGYKHIGYSEVIKDLNSYYNSNMLLLDCEHRSSLFHSGTKILTKIKDSVPTQYGKNAIVKNCLFADGSEIYGKVKNSILFRDVTVNETAVIANSILMQGTVVENDVILDNVICDKNVFIGKGVVLRGSRSHPVVVEKNKVVL